MVLSIEQRDGYGHLRLNNLYHPAHSVFERGESLGSKPNQNLDLEGQIMIRAGQDPMGGDDGEPVLAL
jgi:hypothetical protein